MKCTVCNAEVEYPKFGPCHKQPGNHTVEPKTYVHGGSSHIQNVRDRRRFSPTVYLKADTEAIGLNGERIQTPALFVEFADARYTTTNPEQQWYLENSASKSLPIFWGDKGEEVWRKNQLSVEQQHTLATAELANTQRQIKEANALLEQTKNQKSKASA
jgi:hypothetical protein